MDSEKILLVGQIILTITFAVLCGLGKGNGTVEGLLAASAGSLFGAHAFKLVTQSNNATKPPT
jgi:hypothetical protein